MKALRWSARVRGVTGTHQLALDYVVARATARDVDVVHSLREEAARWMVDRGIEQWRPGELPPTVIEDRVADDQVFLLLLERTKEVVGTVSLAWSDETCWEKRSDDAGYIHMLVVAAPFRGQGKGRQLLDWAEGYIAASGKRWARLDCVRTNSALRRWYESQSYVHVGDREFPAPTWASPVALYEKLLPPASRACRYQP